MNGFKVVFIYYLIYLIIPLVSLFFFRDLYFSAYYISEVGLTSVIYLMILLASIYFIAKRVKPHTTSLESRKFSIFSYPFRKYLDFNYYFSLFFFIFAFGYFFYGTNTYRYGAIALSNQGNLFFILIFRSIAFIYLLYYFKNYVLERHPVNSTKYFSGLSHAFFLIATQAGTADLLIGSFFFLITLSPRFASNLLTMRVSESEFGSRNLARLLIFGLSPFLFIFTLLIGESMKGDTGYLLSFEELLSERGIESLGFFIIFLIDFLSTHAYSFINYIEEGMIYYGDVSVLSEIYQNFLFRLNTVIGGLIPLSDKPEIASVARLNYLELSLIPMSIHEGTSPGYLASAIMVFGKYFGFIAACLYSYFLIITLGTILYSSRYSINLSGAFIICHAILWLFSSPIDFLVILDNSSVMFIFYISFYFYCKESFILSEQSL